MRFVEEFREAELGRRLAAEIRDSVEPGRCGHARRCPSLPLDEIDLLVVENEGNLVCPAEFRIGEDVRMMVSAVTEGKDKPLKYPLVYRTAGRDWVVSLLPRREVAV